MRVALDVSAVPTRVAGAGRYVVELARRLPGAGVTTTLVARRDDAARWRELSSARVLDPVPVPRPARLAYEALRAGRGALAHEVDLWHGPHYTMPRRSALPVVVTVHDLTYFTHPEWHERAKVALFTRSIRHAATHAAALVCVSEHTARELAALVAPSAPVVTAPLGVELERFGPEDRGDAARLEALGLSGGPAILFVGTDEPRKGLGTLLEAFTAVGDLDPAVELWVCGQRGWGDSPLAAALASHPHRDRIRALGYVEDATLPALYRRAAVVAYPSKGEGFGLPVLEAMACGASVVTTAGTVMAEVAGDAARLVESGDPTALATGLYEALVEGEPERARRARAGRARAEGYTWDLCVARHLDAYRIALGR